MESTCKYSVSNLNEVAFANLPIEVKIAIKESGRPTPRLNISQTSTSKSRTFKREFKEELYEKIPWLCGCEQTNKIFCFPCLLFSREKGDPAWVKNGVCDLAHLKQKIKKHESSHGHISATLDFNLLGKVDVRQQLDSAYRQNIKKHNEQVTKNRYVLSKLIDCIKFCGAFELALRGHREDDESLNPGIFKGLVNFSAELDSSLKEHLSTATVFKGTSKEIQNELLDCMLFVCQGNIIQEIKTAQYVSLIADETSDISSVFQLVIVFRYVLPNGQPVERFWKFDNPEGHDAESIAKCICTSLDYVVQNPEKLVSQSYDGANVMSGHHAGVQTIVQQTYKHAFFVHCYAHQLNLIVAQATSQNQDVRIFFSDLSDITNFFSNSPQRVAVLDKIVGKRIPRASATRWNFKSRTVNTVFEYREELIECMEEIQSTSKQPTTIIKAGALARLLRDNKFIFWLSVFHRLMPHVDILYNQLQLTYTDAVRTKANVDHFVKAIDKERANMDKVTELVNQYPENAPKRSRREEDFYLSRTVAAKETCDIITTQIKTRFSFTTSCSAVSLFESQKFEEFEQKFPEKLLEDTVNVYSFLEKNRLKTELEIIYKRTDFRNMRGAVSLLQFFIENNLLSSFSESYKLLLIIATIPMTTAEAERCFSTLKRIKTFLRSTMCQERLTALAMLAIEKEMISNIHNFNEIVIDVFVSRKDRRMDFVYKNCT